MSTVSRFARLALGVAAATTVLACSGDVQAERRDRLVEAADRTTAAKTTKLTYDTHLQAGVGAGAQSLRVWFEGGYDFVNRRGLFSVDLSSLGIHDRAELRLFADTLYVKLGEAAGADRPWVQADLGSLAGAAAAGTAPSPQGGLGQLDPRAAILYLYGVEGPVEELGEEDVRGETTIHYQATVSLAAAAEHFPAPLADQLSRLDVTFPIEVWVDGAGYATRIAYTIDLESLPPPASGPPPEGQISVRQELFGFGSPVEDVEPPSADQVMTLAELQDRVSGS